MTKKFNAFTLAEVLITLGIIGVVAAMTMPTLINQTNGAQYRAAYKKALSAISQGVTLNVALDDISFADTKQGGAGANSTSVAGNGSGTTVASLLQSRMNIVKIAGVSDSGYGTDDDNKTTFPAKIKPDLLCDTALTQATNGACAGKHPGDVIKGGGTEISPDTFLFFNDSSMLAFNSTETFACTQISTGKTKDGDTENYLSDNKVCYGVIDVNGVKGPNKPVSCDGTTADSTCEVKSPTDIYPVQFYDQTILPASAAAQAVLYGK